MTSYSGTEIKALLRKDLLVRWRQKGLMLTLLCWPAILFVLFYLIRLRYGSEPQADCQFPTRLLPTKNQVVPSAFSYICSLENECLSTEKYEEYSLWKEAPLHSVINIINLFVTDDRLYGALVELPEKANFVAAISTVIISGKFDTIYSNIRELIALVPEIERMMDYNFDIKSLFSNRQTFVKLGNLLCGHPFPSTESIPLVNDILYSEDFSEVNDVELHSMPTKYCKRLYLDVTSTNHGKLTWNTIKPIIQGKIIYTPTDADTESIMKFANATFEEMDRLKNLTRAAADIVINLHTNATFQGAFESLLKLARSPVVKRLLTEDFDIDAIERVFNYFRTNQLIYDVLTTVASIMECLSVDRFVPVDSVKELQKTAYEMNRDRMFLAAVNFESVDGQQVAYKIHMDTDNTQPTFENHNRFWFPGPASSMLVDLKYHRGFVQLKQMVDLAIIKYKRKSLGPRADVTTEAPSRSSVTVEQADDDNFDDDDDFWGSGWTPNQPAETSIEPETTTDVATEQVESTTSTQEALITDASILLLNAEQQPKERVKRQGLLDLFNSFTGTDDNLIKYEVDDMQFYTKQFPYPAYVNDIFKRGLYLAQAVQVAFCLGLIVAVAICVRERIWMRESRNSMLMRSMGLHAHSEVIAWTLMTFMELCVIFVLISIVVYAGGILAYTNWLVMMFYCLVFGCALIGFCYMCSNFFTSANIGAVASALLFFITLCPYIIVLLFDAQLTRLQNFFIDLCLATAFAKGWTEIMRMELQQQGLSFAQLLQQGLTGSVCAMSMCMFVLDLLLYVAIGYAYQRYKKTNYSFVKVARAQLDDKLGASLGNVVKMYGNKFAVSNFSLDFARNQVTCLLGRNGAGKSTVIKMLTGQCTQTAGRVLLAKCAPNMPADNVGVCWQDNILIPNLTAREHLELYVRIKLQRSNDDEVRQTLQSLNFGKHENYRAYQLSGGYKRRLCVAIAFIASPSVVILDEPCNGVDAKARKDIWQLIERLRVGRAVIFATHFLDEAKHLSDAVVIMRNGYIVANHNRDSVQRICTSQYTISMRCVDVETSNEIMLKAQRLLNHSQVKPAKEPHNLTIGVNYGDNLMPGAVIFLEYLQQKESENLIQDLTLSSSSLEQEFEQLNQRPEHTNGNGTRSETPSIVVGPEDVHNQSLSSFAQMRQLFGKRCHHFSRNYRLLLYVLLLPAVFELFAMWFVSYRLEDDFDTVLPLSRALYPQTMQMLSLERPTPFTGELYQHLKSSCGAQNDSVGLECREFGNSQQAFYWILNSLPEYRARRYGGYGLNGTGATVWYNNKGYHAMMAWLNDLNTELLRTTLNDSSYSISASNEPWKLGFAELSTTSVLRQAGDSCMVFILLIAFGLVVASASVYLVNERINGEKLQQRLCGVGATNYWLVAFIWDYLVMVLALIVCLSIVFIFGMPVFLDRQQLHGIVGLSLMFSFACVPAVHVAEKLFSDSSISIVSIFCANVIIPLITMGIVLILGVVGDGPVWDEWRYALNRAFLVFPQHALGDGLLEVTKNYMVALVFRRYDIDSYKHPIFSDLLQPHYVALTLMGIICLVLNVLIECHVLRRLWRQVTHLIDCQYKQELRKLRQLKLVSIQSIFKSSVSSTEALRVDNLCVAYKRTKYAVRHVNFTVQHGECFGLLGKNGAGKSTIFKMLTRQIDPDVGEIYFEHPSISYCPQGNALDPLLTVTECILFYGCLRGIKNLPRLVETILETYELRKYRHVLVKNLSGGNRRKLTVATTCCGYTPTVLMDEPTSDMDPVTRAFVYRTIDELLHARRAIVLTSHSISEIEHLCQRVAVLKEGQIVASSSPAQLKAQYGGYYSVTCFCSPEKQTQLAQLVSELLPKACDLQHYTHSLRFLVKVRPGMADTSTIDGSNKLPALSELFVNVRGMTTTAERPVSFAINRCRFDAVFERILDSCERLQLRPNISNGVIRTTAPESLSNGNNSIDLLAKSPAVSGSLSTGYVHCGYEETTT